MDIVQLTAFFKWCTIINGSLVVVWALMWLSASDFVFNTQTRWFSIQRPAYNLTIYSYFALFKIFFLMFNLVPWIALVIIQA